MTEQTKRAIELTRKLFNDGRFHSEFEWNDKIRAANFNPTLKTTLKHLKDEVEVKKVDRHHETGFLMRTEVRFKFK